MALGWQNYMVQIGNLIGYIACFVLSPWVGKLIDRIGYKTVMISDTLLLVIVCFFYGAFKPKLS